MKTRMISHSVWPALHRLAASHRGPVLAAVPYFGSGGVARLNLSSGSTLVTTLNEDAVKAGQIDPREVVKAIRTGVNVFSHNTLHAKVYVFGRTAVVGSANASRSSSERVEACIVTQDKKIVSAATRFVKSVALQDVLEEHAKRLVRHMPKPRRGIKRAKRPAAMDPIWVVQLITTVRSAADEVAFDRAEPKARTAMERPHTNDLQNFRYSALRSKKFRKGQRVVQVIRDSNGVDRVEAPGRIVRIETFAAGSKRRAFVFVEIPSRKRPRKLPMLQRKLRTTAPELAAQLGKKRSRLIQDDDSIAAIERVWR